MSKRNRGFAAGATVLVLTATALYLYKPVSVGELTSVAGFVRYARSFGAVMPLAAFMITVVQAIFPVVPFIILCIANGVLFGLTGGILITWAATLIGASITFIGSRRLGYEWAARIYGKSGLKTINRLEGCRGFWVILALRLLPYFPAPVINVSAGVSGINYLWFLLASAAGKLPFIVGYTVVGYTLLQSQNYMLGLGLIILISVVPYLVMRHSKRASRLNHRAEGRKT